MTGEKNPFVRYGIDPSASVAEITERMRELADGADEAERVALRAAWEALVRSPARRFELVLQAGPSPSPLPPVPRTSAVPWPEPTLADVVAPGPIGHRLPPPSEVERSTRKIDLSFLVRRDETELAGPLGRGRRG